MNVGGCSNLIRGGKVPTKIYTALSGQNPLTTEEWWERGQISTLRSRIATDSTPPTSDTTDTDGGISNTPPPQLSCQKIYGSLKNYVHKLSGVSIIGTPLAKDGQQGSTTLTKLLLSHVSRLNSFSAIFTNSCSLFHENSALGHGELPCARPYCPGQINFLLLIRTLCGPFPSSPWPIWPLPLHV